MMNYWIVTNSIHTATLCIIYLSQPISRSRLADIPLDFDKMSEKLILTLLLVRCYLLRRTFINFLTYWEHQLAQAGKSQLDPQTEREGDRESQPRDAELVISFLNRNSITSMASFPTGVSRLSQLSLFLRPLGDSRPRYFGRKNTPHAATWSHLQPSAPSFSNRVSPGLIIHCIPPFQTDRTRRRRLRRRL